MRRTLQRIAMALCIALALVCYFLIPGIRFSAYFFGGCGVLIAFLGWLHQRQTTPLGIYCYRGMVSLVLVGVVVFTATLGTIVAYGQGSRDALPVDALIVLGAGVNGKTPSLTLQGRIDVAADYLEAHPNIPAVLSGGQGPGEEITEAQAMYDGLVASGIEAERLYLEGESTSTAENFAYAKKVLQGISLDTDTAMIAVVSNDFHLFRATLLAQKEGLHTLGVASTLPWWWLNANYYVREVFALAKTLLLD